MICEKTVNRLCKDDVTKIENYEQAMGDTETWECHHRLELHPDDSLRFTSKSLKKLDLYYNRPASELIFLTKAMHRTMHHKGRTSPNKGMHHTSEARAKIAKANKGKTLSPDAKQKISESKKGKNNPMYGKHPNPATREKLAESMRKRWEKKRAATNKEQEETNG